jgi:eukaryotic-like serine/threonine-protein kinase
LTRVLSAWDLVVVAGRSASMTGPNEDGTSSDIFPRPPHDATLTARDGSVVKLSPGAAAPARDAAEMPALPAAMLERYENVTLLGRGGMGVVYRAHDRRLGRDVALKLLFDDSHDPESLLREARSQARLDHPHACKLHEAGIADGKAYLVMQLIDGAPFDRAQERMTLEEKVTVVVQVAQALHQAHRFGLVHRDVKPGNILVERAEDGAWKPYLTDFGIAREIGVHGQTLTGAIAGTPAFMAPEQARGEVRSLDRRTDVYSLGATLYDVLAGRPPFTAPSAWQLLRQIMTEEAPALRAINRAVPADLEAIVARCLEKEPHLRYDSARALGEDLQRFLDGDPVRARRLSRAYLLLRRARKHKLVVALASAALIAVLVVAALGVRARRIAADQADRAGALGEDVKEMELFLRAAYGLPLHDVEREKDVVRARLRNIEGRMAAAGRAGEGPGHYALGRGHLALQEPEEARAHLEKASLAGYASPDLDYALGLALGELGEKAREAAKRIDNPVQQKALEASIDAEYRDPALRHLRASLGARLETAAYVEGLLLLYEGKPEAALAKAQEAFARMPWLYEAKKLEGDARFAMGSRFRHDEAFDYDRMSVEFQAAAESYQRAAEIARSDSRVHLAECELWAQTMNAVTARKESLMPSFEKAKAACGRAITADSGSEEARLKLSFVHVVFAWWRTTGTDPADPAEILEEALAQGKAALKRSPLEPMAPYVMGEARRAEAQYLNDRGLDSRSSVDGAIASYEEALRLDPTFLWAIHALGNAYALRAVDEGFHGRDPRASLDRSAEYCDRERAVDPSSITALSSAIVTYLLMAEHLADTGRSPAAPLALARKGVEAGKELSHEWPWADYFLSYIDWITAEHELASGLDPSASLERGIKIAGGHAARSSSTPDSYETLGRLGATKALFLLRRGEDPESALHDASSAFQRAAEGIPWDLGFRVWRARVDRIGLQWAVKQHTATAESFRAALAPLTPLLVEPRVDPRLYLVLAEIHQLEAAWLLQGSKSADGAITEGLVMAERALGLNPHLARAFLVKGTLLLQRARAARESADATAAKEALAAAVKENPLLEREIAPAR